MHHDRTFGNGKPQARTTGFAGNALCCLLERLEEPRCLLRADTDATVAVLFGQLAKHPELPREMAGLAEFSSARDADFVDSEGRLKFSGDEVVINFGKNSGRRLRDLASEDPGFLRWMLRSDFSDEVKTVIKNALAGEFPTRKA